MEMPQCQGAPEIKYSQFPKQEMVIYGRQLMVTGYSNFTMIPLSLLRRQMILCRIIVTVSWLIQKTISGLVIAKGFQGLILLPEMSGSLGLISQKPEYAMLAVCLNRIMGKSL